jgi:hypothetical protein
MKVILAEFHRTDDPKTLFEVPGKAEDLIEQSYTAKLSETYLGLLLTQGPYSKESQFLYVYNHQTKKYLGFLDLSKIVDSQTRKEDSVGFAFISHTIQGTLAVAVHDRIYIVAQSQKRWAVIAKTTTPITGLNIDDYLLDIKLQSLPRVGSSSTCALLLIINNEMLVPVTDRQLVD